MNDFDKWWTAEKEQRFEYDIAHGIKTLKDLAEEAYDAGAMADEGY